MEFAPQETASALAALAAPVLDAASRAQPAWLLVALVVHSASILCRVRIWQVLLRVALPQQVVSFRAALGPYLGSVAASVVAPLRGGDAVRIALARRTLPDAHSVTVLATLAAEAIPGIIVVPLLCAAALLLGVLPVNPAFAGLVMLGGAVLALAAWRVSRLAAFRRRDGRLGRVLSDLASGLRLVGSPGRFARTVGPLTVLDWTLRITMIWCLLGAFHLSLSAAAAVAVVSIDSLTTLLPVLPNGAGAQQAAIAGGLHMHASTTALIAFSAGTQLLVGAANMLAGILGFALLPSRREQPVLPRAVAG
ncbi:MAG: glycosyltransferase AglD [Gaiellales bacterium]|jgi:uncharacterized membrane protein YbhN (UPF0104 family)|nr:glycosyltransferase AglD [Gaiellales bacterium]